MMKRLVILVFSLIPLLTSCNFDLYSDQRPYDYGDALWSCGEYNIWFRVDSTKEDWYEPEGEVQIGDEMYLSKFCFINQTNQLEVLIYPIEYATIPDDLRSRNAVLGRIEGMCDFSSQSFVFVVEKITGKVFSNNINVKEMTFQRAENQVNN